jgi:hypothetical protein
MYETLYGGGLNMTGTPGPKVRDRCSCVPGQRVAKVTAIFGLGTNE